MCTLDYNRTTENRNLNASTETHGKLQIVDLQPGPVQVLDMDQVTVLDQHCASAVLAELTDVHCAIGMPSKPHRASHQVHAASLTAQVIPM